jgi:hypothetical protein
MGFFSRSRTAPLPDYASMPVEERVKDPHFQQAFAHLPGFDDAVLVQNADHGALIDPPTELLPSVKIGVFVITPSHMGYAYVESGQPNKVQLATKPAQKGELRHKGTMFIIQFFEDPPRLWSFRTDSHEPILEAFNKVRG